MRGEPTGPGSGAAPDQGAGRTLEQIYAELNDLLVEGPGVPEFTGRLATLAESAVPGARCVIEQTDAASGADSGRRPDPDLALAPLQAARGRGGVSIPLIAEGRTIGTLALHVEPPRTLTEAELVRLTAFARQASTALTLLVRQSASTTLDEQLQEALATRAMIDQALGILMHARRISAREAFEVLRHTSQTTNRRVSAIAADLIESVTGRPPEPPRPLTHRSALIPPQSRGQASPPR